MEVFGLCQIALFVYSSVTQTCVLFLLAVGPGTASLNSKPDFPGHWVLLPQIGAGVLCSLVFPFEEKDIIFYCFGESCVLYYRTSFTSRHLVLVMKIQRRCITCLSRASATAVRNMDKSGWTRQEDGVHVLACLDFHFWWRWTLCVTSLPSWNSSTASLTMVKTSV